MEQNSWMNSCTSRSFWYCFMAAVWSVWNFWSASAIRGLVKCLPSFGLTSIFCSKSSVIQSASHWLVIKIHYNSDPPFDPSKDGVLSTSCTSGIRRLELLAAFDGLRNGISSKAFFLLVFSLFRNPFFIPAKPLLSSAEIGVSVTLAFSRLSSWSRSEVNEGVDEVVVKNSEQSSSGGTSIIIRFSKRKCNI